MPERPATWEDLIRHEAQKARVPPQLALALMQQESGSRSDAVSPVGAQGLFQLMPETAKSLGIDPSDPLQNIRGGVTYLRQQLDATGGDVAAALARYHGGPNLAQHGPQTSAYVQSVLRRLQAPTADAITASGRSEAAPPPSPSGRAAVGAPPPITSIALRRPEEQISRPVGPVAQPPPEPGFLRSVAEQVDPRTRTGRRNIAGGLGAAAATTALAATAPVSVPLTTLTLGTAGVLGAIGMGMAEEASEQLVGTAPPSTMSVLTAGAQQGAYEAGGQAFIWPFHSAGRRFITGKVGKAAVEGLARQKQAITDQARFARQAISDRALTTRQAIVDQTQAAIQSVKKLTARTRETLGLSLESAVGTPPPEPSAAGRAAYAIIRPERFGQAAGPAATARDIAGKAIETAATQGPARDIRPLKAEAQQIVERLTKPATTFPRAPLPSEAETLAASGISPEAAQRLMQQGGPQATAAQEALAGAQAEARQSLLKHPAMAVINRILNAEDTVPFLDAHLWKSQLQQSIQGTYDKAVKSEVQNITQRLAGGLRSMLDYSPYNQATAHYQRIVKLYTKEIAPKFLKIAETEPEALIPMLTGKDPTPARMFRELLTTQAAAGGGGPAGQRAWDLVRSSFTYERLLRGGLDGLDDAMGKLDREFVDVIYGDAAGSQAWTNLKAIATAGQHALARESATIEGAQQAAVTAQRAAKRVETREQRQLIETTHQAMRELRARMTQFTESTLARKRLPGETTADLLRAYFAFPGIWSGMSIGRLLKGPATKDLLAWAYLSPVNTQKFVRALTSPIPAMAIADLLRTALVPMTKRTVGRPSMLPTSATRFAQVGAPPPPP